jgi:glycosidase
MIFSPTSYPPSHPATLPPPLPMQNAPPAWAAPVGTPSVWSLPSQAAPALPAANFPMANFPNWQAAQSFSAPYAFPRPSALRSNLDATGQSAMRPTNQTMPPTSVRPVVRPTSPPVGANDLKQLFHQNRAIIYAINLRTFGAFDKNGDGRISPELGENGTFLSATRRLDELAKLGVNTIHLLPINPIGQSKRMGQAGSLYAPSDYHRLNPEFDTPGNNLSVQDEARQFVQACHQRGMQVMVDVPSCASHDLMRSRPDLILKDATGKPSVPTKWIDIVMFQNNPALQQYYEGFFDLMAKQVGVDGFRVDVARARSLEFWQHFIGKYPDKAWLAESYCEEDQSPLKNLPRDTPEALLKNGFDSIYGQFHIFPSMGNAKEYIDYLLAGRAMFERAGQTNQTPGRAGQTGQDANKNSAQNFNPALGNTKSFIGSFLTHDDPSLIEKGGPLIYMLSSGLMATQPWTNPYLLDGFTTGYAGDFDIFNYVPRHTGQNPEIGRFLQHLFALRKQYEPVLSQGRFIPIPPANGNPDNQVIAFARQAQTPTGLKTLLIVANKDINAQQTATLKIPGLSPSQTLRDLAPAYGRPSQFIPQQDALKVNLGPGRFHLFEIDTPNLAQQLTAY